jgi:hypothetical protein
VVASAAGGGLTAAGMTGVIVAPGRMIVISLVGLAKPSGAAVVSASQPVVAERFVALPGGATRSPGVPSP